MLPCYPHYYVQSVENVQMKMIDGTHDQPLCCTISSQRHRHHSKYNHQSCSGMKQFLPNLILGGLGKPRHCGESHGPGDLYVEHLFFRKDFYRML